MQLHRRLKRMTRAAGRQPSRRALAASMPITRSETPPGA